MGAFYDEVGWGALAGPLISVVTVFRDCDLLHIPESVKDSKLTTDKQRAMLFLELCSCVFDVGVGHAFPPEIDKLGPYWALQKSYERALEELKHKPDILYVDGSEYTNKVRSWSGTQIVEAKADAKHKVVSVASIIAKVFRDTIMVDMDRVHPEYGWGHNKGYGSRDHQEAIKKYGLLIDESQPMLYIHRKRYCQRFLNPDAK